MWLWDKIKPPFWDRRDSKLEQLDYKRLWRTTLFSAVLVTLIPLLLLTGVNFYQHDQQFELHRNEIFSQMGRLLAINKVQVANFLAERRAALTYVNMNNTLASLSDPNKLAVVFRRLRNAFGGFVDLGVIDDSGIQRAYIGPYNLQGKEYKAQDWYKEVLIRGIYVSDVFLGHRNFPHFVIAVRHESDTEQPYVLRATIDTDHLNELLNLSPSRSSRDVFLVNRQGILQTPSHHYGAVLTEFQLPGDPLREWHGIREIPDQSGNPLFVGMAKIKTTPFTVTVVEHPADLLRKWDLLRINVLIMVGLSAVGILVVVWWGATTLVNRIYEADLRRAAVLHEVEYTNKLASIGRLAAGVAHEINNPVAIINEKVGLMTDIMEVSPDFPQKEMFQNEAYHIQDSVRRISEITHRLLGFARHLPVKQEQLFLEPLIKEVLGFLGREADYRNVEISLDFQGELPSLNSDKGQLQQVFLNIINNALAAVEDGGKIEIKVAPRGTRQVEVQVKDNGTGIAKKDYENIFEPFFSTKGERGTGLGLSITYGIVKKLGGDIEVESELGKGSVFTVVLPVSMAEAEDSEGADPPVNDNDPGQIGSEK